MEGTKERAARRAWAAMAGWREAEWILMAASAQERYRRRQRAVAWRFDEFRRRELSKQERRGPWAKQLRAFVFAQANPNQTGSTTLGRAWLLAGLLPEPLSRRDALCLVKSVGASWLFRQPRSVTRTGSAAAMSAAEAAKNPRIRLTCWLIAAAGLRLTDAARIASGYAEIEVENEVFVAYPETEKTDQCGLKPVVEPVVIPLQASELRRMKKDVRAVTSRTLKSDAAANLLQDARTHLRAWGVADVRGARREVAQRVSHQNGRDAASLVLRHEKGSRQTVRYTTTADAVATLSRLLNR